MLAWETKTHEERSVPLADDLVQELGDYLLDSDASPYVFLTLERLAAIDARMKASRWGPKTDLMNNLGRDLQVIQRHARRLLAEKTERTLDEIAWVDGTLHDFRRTYATHMAPHVDLLTLCRWLGHANPKTTQEFYHDVNGEARDRAREAMAGWVLRSKTDEQLTSKGSKGRIGARRRA